MLKQMQTVAGYALIVVGVVGMPLPIFPGTPFLLAGVALLGRDRPIVRSFIKRLERCRQWAGWNGQEKDKTLKASENDKYSD